MPCMPEGLDHHSTFTWHLTVRLAHAFNVRDVQRGRQRPPLARLLVQPGGLLQRSPQNERVFGDAVQDHARGCK